MLQRGVAEGWREVPGAFGEGGRQYRERFHFSREAGVSPVGSGWQGGR